MEAPRTPEQIMEGLNAGNRALFMRAIAGMIAAKTSSQRQAIERQISSAPDEVKMAVSEYLCHAMNEAVLEQKAEKQKAKGAEIREDALAILKEIIGSSPLAVNNLTDAVDQAVKAAQRLHELT